ncbi:MAG: Rrf2 family transcriptional regulator [Mariprofundaceae bacterium]
MTEFAAEPERLRNAAGLAAASHLSVPTVSKVLKLLLKEGLLESIRGAGGGYRLRRKLVDISVQDIIVALEGPIALTECNLGSGDCERLSHCSVSGSWQRINHAVSHALADITLDDMVQPHFEPVIHIQKQTPNVIPINRP